MLIQHIALVSESDELGMSELARVSAALQLQVTRDLGPSWNVVATVDAFPTLDDVPAGYWPIVVSSCELCSRSGIRIDEDGQPYAQVAVSPQWSLDASRACLELLVNPFADRSVTAASLRSDQGPVAFLIEVCGACGDPAYAYSINDVRVSDFCTPAFFNDAPPSTADRYSQHGSVHAPFQLLPGGHLTWFDPVSSSWWSRTHFGDLPADARLGTGRQNALAMREMSAQPACLPETMRAPDAPPLHFSASNAATERAARLRASRLRSLIFDQVELLPEAVASSRPPLPSRSEAAPMMAADSQSSATHAAASEAPASEPSASEPSANKPSSIAPIAIEVAAASKAQQSNIAFGVAAMGLLAVALAFGTVLAVRGGVTASKPPHASTSPPAPAPPIANTPPRADTPSSTNTPSASRANPSEPIAADAQSSVPPNAEKRAVAAKRSADGSAPVRRPRRAAKLAERQQDAPIAAAPPSPPETPPPTPVQVPVVTRAQPSGLDALIETRQ